MMAVPTTRRLLAAVGFALLAAVPAHADHLAVVQAPQLPQFSGPCGTATAGTATFNCNGLLGATNPWTGTNTFPKVGVGTSSPLNVMEVVGDLGVYSTNAVTSGSPLGGRIFLGDSHNSANSSFYNTGPGFGAVYDSSVGLASDLVVYYGAASNVSTIAFQCGLGPNGGPTGCAFTLPIMANGGLTLPAVPVNANGLGADTTANSQNRLSHVANMAAVAGWANTAFPVEVDGTTTPGDGGRRRMTFDSANLCGAGGHPAADGYTCVNSAVVTTGSWNIDWGSVNYAATPQLFPKGSDDTSRIQAAVATGRRVYIPEGTYNVTSDIVMTTAAQVIQGAGRDRTYIVATAAGGFSKGVFVAGTTATPISEEKLRDFAVYPTQTPNPTSASQLVTYPPMFYLQNNPAFEMEHMGCYQAIVCVDMQGNGGQALISDFAFNAFTTGIIIDGSTDRVRIRDPHWYPFTMSSAQQSLFYANSTGISMGRVDGFDISGGLFFGGLAMKFFTGTRSDSPGPPFGNIAHTDFDNYNGINMASSTGTVTCASCTFTVGAGQTGIVQSGGYLMLSASNIGNGKTASNGLVSVSGGVFAATATIFDTTNIDTRAISASGGNLLLDADTFNRDASVANYAADTIYSNGARLVMHGNYGSDRSPSFTGTANFVNNAVDNASRVIGNIAPGWTYKVAGNAAPNSLTGTGGGGVYAGN